MRRKKQKSHKARTVLPRRSIAIMRGRYFAAGGWGRHGPYVVATYRRGRAVVKASAGTRGSTIGANVRVYKKLRVGGEYNLTHKTRSIEIRNRKKKLNIGF